MFNFKNKDKSQKLLYNKIVLLSRNSKFYEKFNLDLKPTSEEINTDSLMEKAEVFFKKVGLLLNWKEFNKLDKIQKINTLAMIAPLSNEEKQTLLESISLKEKAKTLDDIINFYLHEVNSNNQTIQ